MALASHLCMQASHLCMQALTIQRVGNICSIRVTAWAAAGSCFQRSKFPKPVAGQAGVARVRRVQNRVCQAPKEAWEQQGRLAEARHVMSGTAGGHTACRLWGAQPKGAQADEASNTHRRTLLL